MKVYLDHHATTPVDSRVLEAMAPYFQETFGNASSVSHSYGHEARAAVDRARETLARAIGARDPEEIVFTSGATESDNLAILGAARRARRDGRDRIVTVVTEHRAVLDPVQALEAEGFRACRLGVDPEGRIDPEELEAAIGPDTAVVSVMAANNEIGVLQPLAVVGEACRRRDVYFHCDGAQGFGMVDVERDRIDLLSLSAHKIYGPKGVGALYVRKHGPRVKLDPILHGGGHERGMRSGTLNVPGIVGMARAAELVGQEERDRVRALRDRLWDGIQGRIDGVRLNGSMRDRHPGNLNVSFEHVEGEALTQILDGRGIAVSTGSACSSATLEPSHVLKAIGLDEPRIFSSIRFGLGRSTTGEEIDYVLDTLVWAVRKLRSMSPFVETP
jgi:cysteine desulfurase